MVRKKSKSKRKKQERFSSLNHYLNQLLKYELKRLIDIKKRKRSRAKSGSKKPTPPAAAQLPGIIPKMTVVSNSDAPTIKEQQGEKKKEEKKPEPAQLQITVPPQKAAILPGTPSSTPHSTPRKKSSAVRLIDADTGADIGKITADQYNKFQESNKNATQLREKAEQAQKDKEDAEEQLREITTHSAQEVLTLAIIKRLIKTAIDNHVLEDQDFDGKNHMLTTLNQIPGFLEYFFDEEITFKASKTEKAAFRNKAEKALTKEWWRI